MSRPLEKSRARVPRYPGDSAVSHYPSNSVAQMKARFQIAKLTNQEARRWRGQSLTEMAVGFTVLLLLLMLVLDVGRLFFSYIAVHQSVSSGAIFASAFPQCRTASDCPDPTNIEYVVKHESPSGLINWDAANVTVDYPWGDTNLGSPVSVAMSYEFQFLLPAAQEIAGVSISISAEAVQPIISGP